MSDLRDHLKLVADFLARNDMPSLEKLVLEHGKPYERKPKRDDVSYGRAKECFANAGHVIMSNHGGRYRYAEGFAYAKGSIPCHHAWVVDTEDGKAMDPTWRDDDVCGFCLGGGSIEEACEWDDDGWETDWQSRPCDWCNGTGFYASDRDLEHAEYFGVEFTEQEYRRLILKGHQYDILPVWAAEQQPTAKN